MSDLIIEAIADLIVFGIIYIIVYVFYRIFGFEIEVLILLSFILSRISIMEEQKKNGFR